MEEEEDLEVLEVLEVLAGALVEAGELDGLMIFGLRSAGAAVDGLVNCSIL